MSWTTDALELWFDLWDEFGQTYVVFNDIQIPSVCDPTTTGFDPTINAMDDVGTTVFDILRDTTVYRGVTIIGAIQSGLYASVVQNNPQTKRPILTSQDGVIFTGVRFESDYPTQPSIRLIASRKQ